ncbi:MAG TPA: hypothetical protein VF188_01450 [Longimicrobiales bacterium]
MPPAEDWAAGRLVLPGGILDADGGCHKVVRVRELTGRDEEVLSDRRYRNGARQVTDLLARVIVEVEGLDREPDREFAAGMLVGDRDYLLLRLRQLTLGDAVHQVVRCPSTACGERIDIEFLISEIPVRRVDAVRPRYALALSRPALEGDASSDRCVLRLPTGADQEAIAELAGTNPAIANTKLFSRVVLELGRTRRIDEALAQELPLVVRQEIGRFLRDTMPGPDLAIGVQCPHCGGDVAYAFDLQLFFLTSGP